MLLGATLFGGTSGDLGPMMGGSVVNGGVLGMLFTLVFSWVAVVLIGAFGVWISGQVRRCQVMLDRDAGS